MKPMEHSLHQESPEGIEARRKSLLENLYSCPKCSKSFASGRALGGHLASHQRHDKMMEKEAAAAAAAATAGARGPEMGHFSLMLAGRALLQPPEQAPPPPPPLPPRVPTLHNFMNLHPSLLCEPTPTSFECKLPAWMDSANGGAGESCYANYINSSESSGSGGGARNFHGAAAAHNSYYPYPRSGALHGEYFSHAALFAGSNGVLLQTIDLLSQMDVPLPEVNKLGDGEEEELDLTLRL